MEKAIVTFKNPETEQEITINLDYNKESEDIDVDIKFSEGYSMTSKMDFIGFLAEAFLNLLKKED